MNINEAIEKVGKDTQSVDLYTDIPEVKPEDMKLQAVAPVSYVAAVEQSKKDRDKFFKSIEARKEATKDALENTDESRFKRMNKSTGKSSLNVDQPGLKKMHLDESLFEGVQDEEDGWNTDEISELDHYNVLDKIYNLSYEIDTARRGYYTNATTADELANYIHGLSSDLEQFAYEIQELGDSEPEELNESLKEFDKDEKTGLSYGINKDGELYYGDNKSGYNLKDTPENRNRIANDWEEDTGKKVDSKFFNAEMLDESTNEGTLYVTRYIDKDDNQIAHSTTTSNSKKLAIDQAKILSRNLNNARVKNKLAEAQNAGVFEFESKGEWPEDATEEERLSGKLIYKAKGKKVNESKKPLKEATIITDVKSFRPWGVAVDTYNKVKEEEKLDQLEAIIEEMYPDGIESQTFNDLLGYDQDFIYQVLNIKVEEE